MIIGYTSRGNSSNHASKMYRPMCCPSTIHCDHHRLASGPLADQHILLAGNIQFLNNNKSHPVIGKIPNSRSLEYIFFFLVSGYALKTMFFLTQTQSYYYNNNINISITLILRKRKPQAEKICSQSWTRTSNPRKTAPKLHQLSYPATAHKSSQIAANWESLPSCPRL